MDNRLTDKQKRFSEVYLVTQDRIKALTAGGYSLKNASVTASQLLRNPRIKGYLEERSKSLIIPHIDEITAIVKGLDKKEQACVETYKAFLAIKKEDNATKYKYWELLCKLKGHFNESGNVNLFVTQDGKNLSVAEIMEGTARLTGIMREIRFEAEIMRKNKAEEKVSQVVDITPVNDGLHNID